MISALLCLPFLLPQAAEPEDVILRMRDGRVLLCEIVDHDFEGLAVTRSLDGARYRFDWGDLFPGEAERLRAGLGYKIETTVPEVEADRLLLVNGQVLVGRVLRSDTDNIELRTHNTVSLIPRTRLAAPPEKIRVPAPEVLTPEQFYADRVVGLDAASATAHYQFALELQSVFALEQALVHLDLAQALAEAEQDDSLLKRLDPARRSITLSLENKDQAELLERVRQAMNRERFVEAEEALAEFGQSFPDSQLRGEYLDLVDRFDGRRQASMERFLSRRWFTVASTLLRGQSLQKDASVDELLEWSTNELPQLVRGQLAEELAPIAGEVDPGEVDGLWQARGDHGSKRHQATFGNGTWILGEEKARAGLVEAEEDEDSGKTAAQKEMEERTKRYIDNLERQRRRATGQDEVSPEDWWRRAKASQRFQFLLAHYAEFSGDYEVTHVSFSYCGTCGGQGQLSNIELTAQGSRKRRTPCPTCQTIQVQRSITFR